MVSNLNPELLVLLLGLSELLLQADDLVLQTCGLFLTY
jgi:hypothetical protein